MVTSLEGVIENSRIVVDRSDMSRYEGMPVIVTILGEPSAAVRSRTPEDALASDLLVIPTELGQSADAHVAELRANDRL